MEWKNCYINSVTKSEEGKIVLTAMCEIYELVIKYWEELELKDFELPDEIKNYIETIAEFYKENERRY